MSRILVLRNQQKSRSVDLRFLRKITFHLLIDLLGEKTFELGYHFVGAKKMAEINETFLQHAGSTDVITFDYSGGQGNGVQGEVFICIEDAISQAREFKTTWQSELVRYVVHSILHLKGFDDLEPVARKKMKVEENRLVKQLESTFSFKKLGK